MFELRNLSKTFGSVRALKDINLSINDGEIFGLVGENGAGKSTLMKIMLGYHPPDAGQIIIDEKSVQFSNPKQAMDLGIGMVFQEQSLILNISVMENIFLGYESQFVTAGFINWKRMAEAARAQLAKVRLHIDPGTITSDLSFSQRQLVELAKVLTLEERVSGNLLILLDEPTSVLSSEEVQLLFEIVRDLRSRASFVFVSHRLDEVVEISDRVCVMKDGEVVDVLVAKDANLGTIQSMMVGREVIHSYYKEGDKVPFDKGSVLAQVNGISREGEYRDISLALHAGEVLALVGTEGSGSEEIVRTMFGLLSPDTGSIQIAGKNLKPFTAKKAVELGCAYVPRERKYEGIIDGLSVRENMTLSQLSSYSRSGFLDFAKERRLAADWIAKLSIKTPSTEADCGNLSGGNQQKVVLAKWRSATSSVFLLDHPTRGLDVGAKEDIYEMIRSLCRDGCGAIVITDTLDEAIGLAHTIVVLKDGEVQQSLVNERGSPVTQLDLIRYMV